MKRSKTNTLSTRGPALFDLRWALDNDSWGASVVSGIFYTKKKGEDFRYALTEAAEELAKVALKDGGGNTSKWFATLEQAALTTGASNPKTIRQILWQAYPDDGFVSESRKLLASTPAGKRLNVLQGLAFKWRDLAHCKREDRIASSLFLCELAFEPEEFEGLTEPGEVTHAIGLGLDGYAPPAECEEEGPSDKHLVVSRAADIKPEPISWFWPQRIARGKLTLIAGQPGLGKSQVLAAIAAATTTGGDWPCGEGIAPLGSAIILSAEDDPSDTQVPRLMAAGADLQRVHIVTAVKQDDANGNRTFNIQADLDLIERALDDIGDVTLVSIDPLSSYLGKLDSHNNTDVRAVLERLSEMAARRGVAVVGVTHFNKGEGSAINKVIGSIAFVAAARAAFMVAEDPEDDLRRLLVGIKNNLGHTTGALAFRIEEKEVGENGDILAPYIVWDDEPVSDITADEVLAANARGGAGDTTTDEVMDFLRSLLSCGPLPADEVQQEAISAGHLKEGTTIGKDKAFRRAKKKLGIDLNSGTVYREGGAGAAGRWFWSLPEGAEVFSRA
jgi:hypothetical protein